MKCITLFLCHWRTLVDTLEERQKTLVEHVSNMSSMLTDWEINAEKKKEWHLASRILDRSFLVFFIVGLIVSSLAIFLQIPWAFWRERIVRLELWRFTLQTKIAHDYICVVSLIPSYSFLSGRVANIVFLRM